METIKKHTSDIRFWIILFFIIRLYGITNPPLEIAHNWRQVTGLMVARNFFEIDNNIFFPRIDDNQGGTGIIGMEFPTLNYLHYLLSNIFGYTHWYGRFINLIVSSIGIFFFYKILKLFLEEKQAFLSTFLLLTSSWFIYSRKMMPDTYCISLMSIGIYCGITYFQKPAIRKLILYVLFTSLAILSKIPAGIYLVIFVPFILKKINQKIILFSLTSLIPLTLTYLWYFKWNIQLSKNYGSWYNIGKPIFDGILDITHNLGATFEKFYFSSFSSYVIFAFFLVGLFLIFFKREKLLILLFISTFFIFIIYIFKSGFFFYHHSYYIIPFVPIMAIIAAYPLSKVTNKYIYTLLLVLVSAESIANQQHDFFIKKTEKYKLNLEQIADKISNKTDLIAINGNGNPQEIYLSHRKGWTIDDKQLQDKLFINHLKTKCAYLFVNKTNLNIAIKLDFDFKCIYKDQHYLVYDLRSRIK